MLKGGGSLEYVQDWQHVPSWLIERPRHMMLVTLLLTLVVCFSARAAEANRVGGRELGRWRLLTLIPDDVSFVSLPLLDLMTLPRRWKREPSRSGR